VPELPEMEITARRLGPALEGQVVESALAPGINALKTFDPPLHALEGRAVTGVRRRGKLLRLEFDDLVCCFGSRKGMSCACASSARGRGRG